MDLQNIMLSERGQTGEYILDDYIYTGFFCFWLHCVACGISVPWPEIEPRPQQ